MAAPTTENPPSQWSALKDYATAVMTLAAALLAATVTFSERLLSSAGFSRYIVIASWGALLAATIAAVLAAAFSVNYLRNGSRERWAIGCANVAFFMLVLAAGLILWSGWLRSAETPADLPTIVSSARAAASQVEPTVQQWQVQSAIAQPGTGWALVLKGDGALVVDVVVNEEGRLVRATRR